MDFFRILSQYFSKSPLCPIQTPLTTTEAHFSCLCPVQMKVADSPDKIQIYSPPDRVV